MALKEYIYRSEGLPRMTMNNTASWDVILCKGKVTPKQAYVALRGPGG
jgi:hypothetical protein